MEGKRSTIDDHPPPQRAVPTQILSKLWAVLLLFWQNHILPELYFFGHLICIWLLFASSSSNHSLPWTFLVFTPLCKTKYESKQTLCEFQSTVFALFVYKGSRSFFCAATLMEQRSCLCKYKTDRIHNSNIIESSFSLERSYTRPTLPQFKSLKIRRSAGTMATDCVAPNLWKGRSGSTSVMAIFFSVSAKKISNCSNSMHIIKSPSRSIYQ